MLSPPMNSKDVPSAAPILRQEETLLSQVFFSPHNLNVIQNSLRYQVYRATGGKHIIGRQSDVEVMSIMRDVFESSERHVPDRKVVAAVKQLNKNVLDIAVPEVVSAVRFHEYYLNDIKQPNPIPHDAHPKLMTNKGSKVLETYRF